MSRPNADPRQRHGPYNGWCRVAGIPLKAKDCPACRQVMAENADYVTSAERMAMARRAAKRFEAELRDNAEAIGAVLAEDDSRR